MKHIPTPGPWEFDPAAMQVIAPKCGYQSTVPAVIAEVAVMRHGESNGPLLAAAHVMRDALQTIEFALTFRQEYPSLVLLARNAIDKAEGA
jgi:hypothetical protein